MAYRSGTYIAFHADGNNIPGGKSDIAYYNLLCAWDAHKNHDFKIVNSHEKSSAVRDSGKKSTLRASLLERLRNSRNMVLIIGETTHLDTDWVPFEVEMAVDLYKIPIIVAYTVFTDAIRNPSALSGYWPPALKTRIENGTASAIHVPFKQAPLYDAIGQFSHENLPNGSLVIYDEPVGWHTLRHSLGTLMKANGEDVKTIQETLRHANFKVTMDVYTQGITAIRRSAHSRVVRQIMGIEESKDDEE